jgi:hypothetical protein
MGEVELKAEAKRDRVTRRELRRDRYTVSLPTTDHVVFSPNYSEKVLLGEVAETVHDIHFYGYRPRTLSMGYVTGAF